MTQTPCRLSQPPGLHTCQSGQGTDASPGDTDPCATSTPRARAPRTASPASWVPGSTEQTWAGWTHLTAPAPPLRTGHPSTITKARATREPVACTGGRPKVTRASDTRDRGCHVLVRERPAGCMPRPQPRTDRTLGPRNPITAASYQQGHGDTEPLVFSPTLTKSQVGSLITAQLGTFSYQNRELAAWMDHNHQGSGNNSHSGKAWVTLQDLSGQESKNTIIFQSGVWVWTDPRLLGARPRGGQPGRGRGLEYPHVQAVKTPNREMPHAEPGGAAWPTELRTGAAAGGGGGGANPGPRRLVGTQRRLTNQKENHTPGGPPAWTP